MEDKEQPPQPTHHIRHLYHGICLNLYLRAFVDYKGCDSLCQTLETLNHFLISPVHSLLLFILKRNVILKFMSLTISLN